MVALLSLITLLSIAPPAVVATDGPVGLPGVNYRADVVVLQLAPEATRSAWATLAAGPDRAARAGGPAPPLRTLGTPALDRVAATLGGVEFEPEFPADGPGSDGTASPLAAFWIAHLPEDTSVESASTAFMATADVAHANASALCAVSGVPDDPLWAQSYYFYQSTRRDIHALEAWDITTGDSSIVVAILDTGVIPYHPDLGAGPGMPSQIWTNWAEINGAPGVDDDRNGYKDDAHGWDFVALPNPTATGVMVGEDWRDADNDPNDFAGHGTAVAGIVGAHGNNGLGAMGAAWKVRLMPLRVAWATTASPLGQVDMTYVAQAVRYATRMGANVINCSFESRFQNDLATALDDALAHQVTVVAAAGNKGTQEHYIGDREEVLTVTSTEQHDIIPRFANIASYVDVAAPGASLVTTTVLPHATQPPDSISQRSPAYTSGASGTSFSSALASGVVALFQAQRRARGLALAQPFEAQFRIIETADDISAVNPDVTGYGSGRMNALRVLTDPPTSAVLMPEATMVGPGVPMPAEGKACCAAVALADSRIAVLDIGAASVRQIVPLAGAPVGGIAAAPLGGKRPWGMFVATSNGEVAGFDENGTALPGWPVAATSANKAGAMPALGDLDGDGGLEVVWGGSDGRVWAWHADGTTVAGFPRTIDDVTTGSEDNLRIALSDLDGQPGVEIAVVTAAGRLFALDGNGDTMPGSWPADIAAQGFAPTVTRFGDDAQPSILVAATSVTYAYAPDGTQRWKYFALTEAASEPVPGDLNGDGVDEVIVSRTNPTELRVLNSIGTPVHFGTWPKKYAVAPQGTPLMGHTSLPEVGPTLLWTLPASGIYVYDSSTAILKGYPKPGRATADGSLWDYDGDRQTEILGGPPGRPGVFVYRLTRGSWRAAKQAWPTPRGNFARTGSTLYNPGVHEDTPVLISLVTASAEAGVVHLEWLAGGDRITSATLERRIVPGPWLPVADFAPDARGRLSYDDRDVREGAILAYRLAVPGPGSTVYLGEVDLVMPGIARLALAGARPNPAVAADLQVAFALATRSSARLELIDVAGRRCATREVGSLGPGNHVVALPAARLAPGVYLLRLLQNGDERHTRCAIVR